MERLAALTAAAAAGWLTADALWTLIENRLTRWRNRTDA